MTVRELEDMFMDIDYNTRRDMEVYVEIDGRKRLLDKPIVCKDLSNNSEIMVLVSEPGD